MGLRVAVAPRENLVRLRPQSDRGMTVSGVRMLDAVSSGVHGNELPRARDETG